MLDPAGSSRRSWGRHRVLQVTCSDFFQSATAIPNIDPLFASTMETLLSDVKLEHRKLVVWSRCKPQPWTLTVFFPLLHNADLGQFESERTPLIRVSSTAFSNHPLIPTRAPTMVYKRNTMSCVYKL